MEFQGERMARSALTRHFGGGCGGSESSLCPTAFCASREEVALAEEACRDMVHDTDTVRT
jgi:hypothetical protein